MSVKQIGSRAKRIRSAVAEYPPGSEPLRYAIAAEADGFVYIRFDRPVDWFALPKAIAKEFALAMLHAADDK